MRLRPQRTPACVRTRDTRVITARRVTSTPCVILHTTHGTGQRWQGSKATPCSRGTGAAPSSSGTVGTCERRCHGRRRHDRCRCRHAKARAVVPHAHMQVHIARHGAARAAGGTQAVLAACAVVGPSAGKRTRHATGGLVASLTITGARRQQVVNKRSRARGLGAVGHWNWRQHGNTWRSVLPGAVETQAAALRTSWGAALSILLRDGISGHGRVHALPRCQMHDVTWDVLVREAGHGVARWLGADIVVHRTVKPGQSSVALVPVKGSESAGQRHKCALELAGKPRCCG